MDYIRLATSSLRTMQLGVIIAFFGSEHWSILIDATCPCCISKWSMVGCLAVMQERRIVPMAKITD